MPNAPTVGELEPSLNLSLWNGLFVKADVKADVRAKLRKVAMRAVLGAKAQQIARDTGALIYWKEGDASDRQIAADRKTMQAIWKMLE